MIGAAFVLWSTSYVAWFIERHETRVVYPFNSAYSTPADAGEPRMAETRFETADGESLVVWRGKARGDAPTVLYLSGNAGTLADRAWRFGRMLDEGYNVIAPAYRGSSGSTGKPDERVLTRDALALAGSLNGEDLIIYGESLGSAVAVKLAADGHGSAVILEAPFTSIPDLVMSQYPAEDVRHLFTQVWNSGERISDVRQPLLIVHGEADRLVPVEMGQALLKAAGSASKEIVIVPEQGHHALWTGPVQKAVFAFLDMQ